MKTDPTFMIAEGMVREIRRTEGGLHVVGQTAISSRDFIHGNDRDDNGVFANWYNFARTAAVTLRLYMLEATDIPPALFDPKFKKPGKTRNRAAMTSRRWGVPINMADDDKFEARRLSAEFDRLYPHYTIQNRLNNMQPHETRSIPNLMYVVDFPNRLLYHIAVNMDVTLQAIQGGEMIIRAMPHVAVFKLRLPVPPEGAQQQNFPRYFLLRELIDEHNARYEGQENNIVDRMARLNVEEGAADEAVQEMVQMYFDNEE